MQFRITSLVVKLWSLNFTILDLNHECVVEIPTAIMVPLVRQIATFSLKSQIIQNGRKWSINGLICWLKLNNLHFGDNRPHHNH